MFSDFFEKTFLFKNVDKATVEKILESIHSEKLSYQKGDVIYSPSCCDRKIGFVYQGECSVGRQAVGAVIPLNVAKKFDSFGILSCFSDSEDFPTVITAKTNSTVVFISADDLKLILCQNSTASLNVIEFLARKIEFLNDKIAAFSGGSIEEKLASYILSLRKKYNSLEFEFNKKKSAEALNCGRASLYRAIDALKSANLITLEEKKIIINDPSGLERITK